MNYESPSQSKTNAVVIIDCGTIQNIEEQCGRIFTADIHLKIYEDNIPNNFDKYIF